MTSNFAHVSNRLLYHGIPVFFIAKLPPILKAYFSGKQSKNRLFKKYFKRRKSRASLNLSLGSRHIGEKKSLKTTILYFFSIKILNTFYKVTATNKKQILILLVQELIIRKKGLSLRNYYSNMYVTALYVY